MHPPTYDALVDSSCAYGSKSVCRAISYCVLSYDITFEYYGEEKGNCYICDGKITCLKK